MESETDKIDEAIEEFDGEYDDEELRLYRIKFISEVANQPSTNVKVTSCFLEITRKLSIFDVFSFSI